MKKRETARIRFVVMLAFVAVAAIGFFASGGIGNVCGIGFDSITLLCPLGAILVMISERTAIPLAIISVIAVIAVCALLGKVFCSWVCPVHFMTAWRSRKKKAKKPGNANEQGVKAPTSCAACDKPCGKREGVKLDSRHAILAAAIASTLIFGFPVFCLVCPVGLTFALVLLVMRLFVFGETTWTIILFLAVIVAEVVFLPNWCKSICPLGALHGLFSGLNKTFRPTIDSARCIQESKGAECNLCVEACHENINLHDVALGATTIADCSKCKACSDACPVSAISFPLFASKETSKAQPEHGAIEPKAVEVK